MWMADGAVSPVRAGWRLSCVTCSGHGRLLSFKAAWFRHVSKVVWPGGVFLPSEAQAAWREAGWMAGQSHRGARPAPLLVRLLEGGRRAIGVTI